MKKKIIMAITGASGSLYAKRLFDLMHETGAEIDIIFSETGKLIWKEETGCSTSYFSEQNSSVYKNTDLSARIASGSCKWHGMVIIPASMGTVGRIAAGISNSLTTRVADVTLKEKRKLIIVPRETPLSAIHLKNMLRLDRCGATILPASPGFYHKPSSIDDIIDFIVARVMDQLEIEQNVVPGWDPGLHIIIKK